MINKVCRLTLPFTCHCLSLKTEVGYYPHENAQKLYDSVESKKDLYPTSKYKNIAVKK